VLHCACRPPCNKTNEQNIFSESFYSKFLLEEPIDDLLAFSYGRNIKVSSFQSTFPGYFYRHFLFSFFFTSLFFFVTILRSYLLRLQQTEVGLVWKQSFTIDSL
jgi:hypothetical protein